MTNEVCWNDTIKAPKAFKACISWVLMISEVVKPSYVEVCHAGRSQVVFNTSLSESKLSYFTIVEDTRVEPSCQPVPSWALPTSYTMESRKWLHCFKIPWLLVVCAHGNRWLEQRPHFMPRFRRVLSVDQKRTMFLERGRVLKWHRKSFQGQLWLWTWGSVDWHLSVISPNLTSYQGASEPLMAYDDRTEWSRTLILWSSRGERATLFIPGPLLVLCAGDSPTLFSGSPQGAGCIIGTSFLIRGAGS